MAEIHNFKRTIRKQLKKSNKFFRKPIDTKSNLEYSIDSPAGTDLESNILNFEGWIIPKKGTSVTSLTVSFESEKTNIKFGLERKDVAQAFPDNPKAINSGFSHQMEIKRDGLLILDVQTDDGRTRRIYENSIRYSPEKLVRDIYNPDLSKNWAEHVILQNNKKAYYYEEENVNAFTRGTNDPRLVAFYLPQFHPIEENDKVWGKNFTEWTNVTTDTPRFVGHMQPILPKDTGFYDLRLEENMKDQINRAKKHGIYGFCFYYYWFSGKRLLEKPLDMLLKNQDWDFNFSICWANENWTKRWDGRDSEIIVEQKYRTEDPLTFIKDVEHILIDPRYIRENGKPVLTVFRASELKNPQEYAKVWRSYFRKKYKTELQLVSIISFDDRDPREYGFDIGLDFAPQSSFFKNRAFEDNKYPFVNVKDRLIDKDFAGLAADYRKIALNNSLYEFFNFPMYKCVTPSWDNDARKKNKGFVMVNESPDIYAQWLDNVLGIEKQKSEDPLVFINAWNEWAEGAILEPSMHYGSAVLNRTTEVLAKYSARSSTKDNITPWGLPRAKTKLAVVVHLYYPERWDEIINKLNYLNKEEYSLFVSLNIKDEYFSSTIREYNNESEVFFVPNRGRDILPFINLLPKLKAAGYLSVLKLHSKKSDHRNNGHDWFDDMISKLLPNRPIVQNTIKALNSGHVLIGPAGHFVSLRKYMGANENNLSNLLAQSLGTKESAEILNNSQQEGYFAGSMFWASLSALDSVQAMSLLPEDFESEDGQIDGTFAHAIERHFTLYARHKFKCFEVDQNGLNDIKNVKPTADYPYAD